MSVRIRLPVKKNQGAIIDMEPFYYKGLKLDSEPAIYWALLFDACKVNFEYQPNAFHFDNRSIQPDFLLHDVLIRAKDTPIDLYVFVLENLSMLGRAALNYLHHRDWDETYRRADHNFFSFHPFLVVSNLPLPVNTF